MDLKEFMDIIITKGFAIVGILLEIYGAYLMYKYALGFDDLGQHGSDQADTKKEKKMKQGVLCLGIGLVGQLIDTILQ